MPRRTRLRQDFTVPMVRPKDAVFQRETGWRKWACDAESLIRLVRSAHDRVREHSDQTLSSLELEFPDAGRGVMRRDLDSFIDQLRANFSRLGSVDCTFLGRQKGSDDPHLEVRIVCEESPYPLLGEEPVWLQVRGTDETMVDGVFDQIEDQMNQTNRAGGEAIRRLPMIRPPTLFVGALGVAAAGVFAVNVGDPNTSDWALDVPATQIVAVAGGVLLCFLLLGFLAWVQVPLEFLGAGRDTRWERSRRWALGTGAGLILAVVGIALTLAE